MALLPVVASSGATWVGSSEKLCARTDRQSRVYVLSMGFGQATAQSCGADLIVMGGYGHRRMRELIFGGCTQSALEAGAAPLVFPGAARSASAAERPFAAIGTSSKNSSRPRK